MRRPKKKVAANMADMEEVATEMVEVTPKATVRIVMSSKDNLSILTEVDISMGESDQEVVVRITKKRTLKSWFKNMASKFRMISWRN